MGNKAVIFILGLMFVALIGCAKPVHKDWFAMGGEAKAMLP
jgi:hypothetical protein